MTSTNDKELSRLSWTRADIEERLGVRGGRYTHTNAALTFFLALITTAGLFGILIPNRSHPFVAMLTDRGPVQYVTVLFTIWAAYILLVKMHKIRVQRKALQVPLIPKEGGFVLSVGTVSEVLDRIHGICDNPQHFVLFNRIELGLCNLRNIGRVADLSKIFHDQADNDEDTIESSYGLIKGLVWAIPVLGFIGTVQGLSQAISKFGSVLSETADIATIKPALQGVTAGLATAFETTLIALVAALAIQMWITLIRRSEEQLLDDCKEYCQRQILGRVKLSMLERGG
ncbi:MAG: hypothetical protein KatS3mg104_1642 [Phycisphaerae bacterium]|jgi:hypothetical protein|nr:MAG: hypothetical protein KatS3mg104_1642 [Phycisphaerae bacterium]